MSFFDKYKKKKRAQEMVQYVYCKEHMLGEHLHFDASEAYKLLRTNLMFSLPDTDGCRVIGMVSALRGEGKSLNAINTAYSLAQLGKKVLLAECDLRLPTIGTRLTLKQAPGLCNWLREHGDIHEVIQTYGTDTKIHVLTSGNIPPNPAEYLNSPRVGLLFESLKQEYDYIIIDLPPVQEVSDALVLSKYIDGMIMVVHQDYSNRSALDNTISQLQFVEAKILGFLFNSVKTNERAGQYGKYRYRKYKYDQMSGDTKSLKESEVLCEKN